MIYLYLAANLVISLGIWITAVAEPSVSMQTLSTITLWAVLNVLAVTKMLITGKL